MSRGMGDALGGSRGRKGPAGDDGAAGAPGAGAVPLALVRATNTSAQQCNGAVVTGWTEQEDTEAAFNAATGVFTAPADGWYTVDVQLSVNDGGNAGPGNVAVRVNGTVVAEDDVRWTGSGSVAWAGSLSAADTVDVFGTCANGAVPLNATGTRNTLSIAGWATS